MLFVEIVWNYEIAFLFFICLMEERKLIREIHPLKSAKMGAGWLRIEVGRIMNTMDTISMKRKHFCRELRFFIVKAQLNGTLWTICKDLITLRSYSFISFVHQLMVTSSMKDEKVIAHETLTIERKPVTSRKWRYQFQGVHCIRN